MLQEEPACVGVAAYRRLRARFFAGVVAGPAVHAPTISFVAFVIAVAAWRFACPTAWPRSEPAAALAPLSHMLMNGFFLIQGFFIRYLAILTLAAHPRDALHSFERTVTFDATAGRLSEMAAQTGLSFLVIIVPGRS